MDLFKETLADLVGNRVKSLTMFTMARDFELADAVGPYRKSLLYLVSRSFEAQSEMPVLGLEESLRRDPGMTRFFGLLGSGQKRKAEIFFSVTETGPRTSTIAKKHGDFDNDRLTMASVIRRILGVKDGETIVEFPETASRTVLDDTRGKLGGSPAAAPSPPVVVVAAPAAPNAATGAASSGGRRRAVCVGIDEYPAPNALAGCVNDANDWATVLRGLQFETQVVTNQDATWEKLGLLLSDLASSARAGDTIVFQVRWSWDAGRGP